MSRQISPVDGDLVGLLNEKFTNHFRHGWVTVDGCTLPARYEKFAEAIENLEVRDDDIWVSGFPKTGTTWTQAMVWCIANDLDSEQAKLPLDIKSPFLELSVLYDLDEIIASNPDLEIPDGLRDSLSYFSDLPSPRFVKTHLPFHLLPRQIRTGEKKPKIVYVVRNPKDACISFFHHCVLLEGFKGDFTDFIELFLADKVHYAPFWKNVLSYWKKTMIDNLLFIKYEDMKKDLPSVIKQTATFLGKNLTSDQVAVYAEHLSLESMKKNPAINNEELVANLHEITQVKREGEFIRSGQTEQWKTGMTPEVIQRFDDWIRENLKGTGLSL